VSIFSLLFGSDSKKIVSSILPIEWLKNGDHTYVRFASLFRSNIDVSIAKWSEKGGSSMSFFWIRDGKVLEKKKRKREKRKEAEKNREFTRAIQ
jgi:hypothetical protein